MNPVGVREIEMDRESESERDRQRERDMGRRLLQMVFNSEKQH